MTRSLFAVRFTIRRAIAAIATAAAGTGVTYYATTPDSPQTTTHAFTMETCGQFSLYSWHQILSLPQGEIGNPLILWTGIFGKQPAKGPTT